MAEGVPQGGPSWGGGYASDKWFVPKPELIPKKKRRETLPNQKAIKRIDRFTGPTATVQVKCYEMLPEVESWDWWIAAAESACP